MAEIIDIRRRLKSPPEGDRAIFRVRLCGPDLRWIGLVGGVLSAALAEEGFCSAFEDLELPDVVHPVLVMRAGRGIIAERGPELTPGLVVAGSEPSAGVLQGCNGRTVLLAHSVGSAQGRGTVAFPGTALPLRVADPAPEPLGIAVASIGGAARLLGVIGWEALEEALREELTLSSDVVDFHLALALEAYSRIARWEGIVPQVREEAD